MAHVRREFTKVYESLNRPQPGKPSSAIAELYALNRPGRRQECRSLMIWRSPTEQNLRRVKYALTRLPILDHGAYGAQAGKIILRQVETPLLAYTLIEPAR